MSERDGPIDRNRFELAEDRELALIRALGARLDSGHFFSHRSAALLWQAPMPHAAAPHPHVSAFNPRRTPRIAHVRSHTFEQGRVAVTRAHGLQLLTPASTFVTLGTLDLPRLVAVGDYFLRCYRSGHGRKDAGKPALATRAELAEAVALGRWPGMAKLRQALELVREDSWSPRETLTRLILISAGLPEPELNVDIYDDAGVFLGCSDMVYRKYRVIVEYQGKQHAHTYAEDIERLERLRQNGWDTLQVTNTLFAQPAVLAARASIALRKGGWRGSAEAVGRG